MSKLTTIFEFFKYLIKRRKWWLAPIVILLLILGAMIILSQGSVLAPFIYTIF